MKSNLEHMNSKHQHNGFIIRQLTLEDNEQMAEIIRLVSNEYGFSENEGYGVSDLAKKPLSHYYKNEVSGYWVIEYQGKLVGGAGISPIESNDVRTVCELQKMYFLSNTRGLGLGQKLSEHCLNFAKMKGFTHCYLETTAVLKGAYHLYKKLGFEEINQRIGNTGHSNCEILMLKALL
ncbi:GNAT family N-acetyltransferase [Parashewanella spongiae]|uniref:GNAT family N-acetyltransferase n=1 Tax=Parashewanella spongiae TaxID=342950 RepID=A0A3A6TFE6_9GAMM|nr:GNAT family N-acetyltransferase [Parashewanella spongiae]MCL1078858.1 GNAT family N-acetyltransferase [Parashewanella spongiae]RJY11834.1 GNAT family N-acetyltransferase [Parashewanella spongiae]